MFLVCRELRSLLRLACEVCAREERTRAALDRAAVRVRSGVRPRREELGEEIAVRRMDLHAREARALDLAPEGRRRR